MGERGREGRREKGKEGGREGGRQGRRMVDDKNPQYKVQLQSVTTFENGLNIWARDLAKHLSDEPDLMIRYHLSAEA